MNLHLYLILFFGVIISGISIFLFKKQNKKTLKLVLSFSGAYLFAISMLHLIPDVFADAENPTKIGMYVLIGFLIQLLLELFSEGIEHGHVHLHSHETADKTFPIAITLSLYIHSVLEGMPLNTSIAHDHNSLFWGILLHKIPVSFAFASLLYQAKVSKTKIVLLLVILAISAPLGAALSHFLGTTTLQSIAGFYNYIMAIVIGMFLHISTTILFESSEGHKFNVVKFGVILLGGAIAMLSVI